MDSRSVLDSYFIGINGLTLETKDALLKKPLNRMYNVYPDELDADESSLVEDRWKRYDINFDDITVDELRIRIQTFNNLVVRLPVDTKHNKMASLHIFRDWLAFVEGAVNHLLDAGELFMKDGQKEWEQGKGNMQGLGTDCMLHNFDELYVDQECSVALVDYSYICENGSFEQPYIDDKTGKPVADRWDYWSESDFN